MTPTSQAPLMPATVTLNVHDMEAVAGFYETIIGLTRRHEAADNIALGTAERTLVVLSHTPDLPAPPPTAPGLYHTAFLVPTRADLGAWLNHARSNGFSLSGAADHHVSEALYINDPEGNGIEVYVDRPRSAWTVSGDQIKLVNDRIDLDPLSQDGCAWEGAPAGTVIGHFHFKVGDLQAAEAFWQNAAGLTTAAGMEKARFLGSGGYHHHVGINIWHSQGGGALPQALGLAGASFEADEAVFNGLHPDADNENDADAFILTEPSGLPITICKKG